jgi:hypothetical protein
MIILKNKIIKIKKEKTCVLTCGNKSRRKWQAKRSRKEETMRVDE